MKATELRIGNAVILLGKVSKVDELTRDALEEIEIVVESGFGLHYGNSDISPVKINKTNLKKLGFNKDRFGNMSIGIWCLYQMDEKGWWFNIRDKRDNSLTGFARIKFIHQLQNLYFSVTGKELEFKSAVGKNNI